MCRFLFGQVLLVTSLEPKDLSSLQIPQHECRQWVFNMTCPDGEEQVRKAI